MKQNSTSMIAVLSVVFLGLLTGVTGQLLGQGGTVVSKFGQAQIAGRNVIVHVTVVVRPGADANQVALDAIRNQGARPFQSDEFSTTGLVWNQFLNGTSNPSVEQYYNPADDPTGGAGQQALTNSQSTWSGVWNSKFALDFEGTTTRCPSLVRECKGPQVFDTFNDVAWLSIGGCCTLAVTWSSTDTDEADMAVNTKFSWATDGISDFDLETVILHELGHVGGLGHSQVSAAVMFADYQTVRQDLHQDDRDGITFLYPDATGAIIGTVTQGGSPIAGATVSVDGTSIEAITGLDGGYDITIAAPGMYDLTASASDFIKEEKLAVSVNVDRTTWADFALEVDPNPPDSASLEIWNVDSQTSGKGGTFKITWNTNKAANSAVTFDCCGTFTNSELVTDHSMSFRGKKGDTYTYSVRSTNADGTVTSGPHTHPK